MKSVRMLALALAVGGMTAAARGGDEGAPGLLPLPELMTTWSSPQGPVVPAPVAQPQYAPPAQPVAYVQPGPTIAPASVPQAPPIPPETGPVVSRPNDVFDSVGG